MKIKIVTKTESGYLCEDAEGIGSSMWRIYPSYNNGDDFNQISYVRHEIGFQNPNVNKNMDTNLYL